MTDTPVTPARRSPVLRRAAAGAVFACVLAAAAPLAYADPGPATIRSGSLGPWASYVENTATSAFVDGPGTPPAGTGSMHFLTGNGTGAAMGGKNYLGTNLIAGTLLSDLTELSYDTWVDHDQNRLAPALYLNVSFDGNDSRETSLVFEPVYQAQPVVAQTWQHWDVASGQFRISKAYQDLDMQGAPYTLADLATRYPLAHVVTWYPRPDGAALILEAGQSSGEIWQGFDGNIDNVHVARTGPGPLSETYDFEGGSAPCTTTCYVDATTGDDANSGSSPAEAKRTVQQGVVAVDAGGTVQVAAGTYGEHVTAAKSLTLAGAGAGATRLQGGYLGDPGGDGITVTAADVTVRDVTSTGFRRGIELIGPDADRAVLTHLAASGNTSQGIVSENFDLDGLTVDDVVADSNGVDSPAGNGRGLWVINGDKSNVVVTGSTFTHNGLVGLDISDGTVTGATITGNTVTDNGDAGIGLFGALGSDNRISGNNVGGPGRFGIEVKNSTGSVSVDHNTVTRSAPGTRAQDYAGIAVLQRGGAAPANATVADNAVTGITSSASDGFGVVVEGSGHTIARNTLTGNDVAVQVQGGNTANQTGTDYFDRGNAAVGSAAVVGNTIKGNGVGVRVVGGTTAGDSAGVSITGNVLRGNARGIDVRSTGATGLTTATFNEIVGNTRGGQSNAGLRNDSASTVDATDNWWGCNTGPGSNGCDPVVGTGTTGADPWLVLTARLGDSTLDTGQSTGLTGDLRTDNHGQAAVGAPDGGVVTFDGGTLATVDPTTDTLQSQLANTTLTAGGTTGSSAATAGYDNALDSVTYVVQAPLAVSIGDVTKAEGNLPGTTPFTFTVSLNRASDTSETVAYATSDGTATAPSDYTSRTGTLTFAAGETTRTVTVPVVRDTTTEPTETFTVDLVDAGTSPAIADGSGLGTIVNDDARPRISVGDVGTTEGNTGTHAMRFPVRLDRASSTTVTARFTTADGSATSPSDYAARSGTVTFAPGTTLQYVDIQVRGDRVKEPNETLTLNAYSPTGASLLDPNGSGVIRNDD